MKKAIHHLNCLEICDIKKHIQVNVKSMWIICIMQHSSLVIVNFKTLAGSLYIGVLCISGMTFWVVAGLNPPTNLTDIYLEIYLEITAVMQVLPCRIFLRH